MTQTICRSLLALCFALVLSACQTQEPQISEPAIDEFAVSMLVFDTYINDKQLLGADQQLQDLRANYPDDARLADLQQRLASAWLRQGQQALQNADVPAASTALMHAKRLMPEAPALTEGLSAALAEMQAEVAQPIAVAEVKTPPVKRPTAVKRVKPAPVKKVPAPAPSKTSTVPSESIQELVSVEPVIEPSPIKPSKPNSKKARMIDPQAESTTLLMPMLASRNDHQLGRFLDDVAIDVVRFRAAVSIEVADTRDFHWVATLLSTRVKKLDANFKPRLQEVIRSDSPAQLVITPNKQL